MFGNPDFLSKFQKQIQKKSYLEIWNLREKVIVGCFLAFDEIFQNKFEICQMSVFAYISETFGDRYQNLACFNQHFIKIEH